MRIKSLFVCLAITLLLGACTGTRYHITPQDSAGHAPKLVPQEKVLVAIPRDGEYLGTPYRNSGTQVADLFIKHISSRTGASSLTNGAMNQTQALSEAQALSCRYVVIPVINNWEPRASSWSGKPGRASISVSVYELVGEKPSLINKSLLEVQGKSYLTEHPLKLMDNIIGSYIGSLY